MSSHRAGTAGYILIADDDTAIRNLFGAALTNAGYEVEVAADGDLAMEAIGRRCPDLLLADLVMPGLTGDNLARRLRERCPDAVIVFVSGYTEDQLRQAEILQVVFLPKPISPKELVRVVGNLLDGGPGQEATG